MEQNSNPPYIVYRHYYNSKIPVVKGYVMVKENMDATCKCYVQGLGTVLHRAGTPEQPKFER